MLRCNYSASVRSVHGIVPRKVGDDQGSIRGIPDQSGVRLRKHHDLHASCLLAGAGHGASKAPTGRARKRASRGDSLVDGLDLIAAAVGDDANSGALCERRHDLPGESQDSRLTRRTVADHES
jgi:hypothetical protein